MIYRTLISPAELAAYTGDPDWVIVDCRFSLTDTELGRRSYAEGHLPGAVYAHLDADLSGPIVPGQTGRHPLPSVEACAATFAAWGIGAQTQVVAYDDRDGMYAARLWWMLRWLGHDRVALLDGGYSAWVSEGRPVTSNPPAQRERRFIPRPQPGLQADAAEIAARLSDPTLLLLDARKADRYRGENETIDPVGGHIPGALSAPYVDNLGADGRFLPPEVLRARWQPLLAGRPAGDAIVYCGSGVSAVHNLIALEVAGLGSGRLYVGSWSEWIADPRRPLATGADPS